MSSMPTPKTAAALQQGCEIQSKMDTGRIDMLMVAIRMLEILHDETAWTKRAQARDRHGSFVQPTSPRAQCWCIVGVAERAADDLGLRQEGYPAVLRRLQGIVGGSVIEANDDPATTFAMVRGFIVAIADGVGHPH